MPQNPQLLTQMHMHLVRGLFSNTSLQVNQIWALTVRELSARESDKADLRFRSLGIPRLQTTLLQQEFSWLPDCTSLRTFEKMLWGWRQTRLIAQTKATSLALLGIDDDAKLGIIVESAPLGLHEIE